MTPYDNYQRSQFFDGFHIEAKKHNIMKCVVSLPVDERKTQEYLLWCLRYINLLEHSIQNVCMERDYLMNEDNPI